MCPDWELNQWPLAMQAGTQSTELHQPGLFLFFYISNFKTCFLGLTTLILQIDHDSHSGKCTVLDSELEYRDCDFIIFLLAGASSAWHEVGAPRCYWTDWRLERGVWNEIGIKGVDVLAKRFLGVSQAAEAKSFWYLCLVDDFRFWITQTNN